MSYMFFQTINSQFLVTSSECAVTEPENSDTPPLNDSLQNLSKAITQRQKSENGIESLASSNGSLPSLWTDLTTFNNLSTDL